MSQDMVLVKYDAACHALAIATSVDEVKEIRNKTIAIAQYARQEKNTTLLEHAKSIIARAEIKGGELLAELEAEGKLAKGGKPYQKSTGAHCAPVETNVTEEPTLADMGVDKHTAKVFRGAARLPDDQKQIALAGKKSTSVLVSEIKKKKNRAQRVKNIQQIAVENQELSIQKKYPVIYADPPWQYEYSPTDTRKIENQYPTMSLDQIKSLPVKDIASPSAVLFLWATSPKLDQAIEVMAAWGFQYRTCAVWDKEIIGMGYYFRQQHEILLLGTRGELPAPEPQSRVSSVFRERRGKHSAKPLGFYKIIENMFPEYEKIELFCRAPQPGWNVWGNQSNGS